MIDIYQKENVMCVEGTLENFGRKVFVYLVDGMLVDTGPENLGQELIPFYNQHELDQVVLTHNHEDHTGMAAWIQENLKAPIYGHPIGIEVCEKPGDYPPYRQQTWGGRKAFIPLPLQETIQSRNGEWKVIHTPGHAEDHVSFLNEETGQLFTGDLFVSPKTKVIMDSESIPLIMNSIRQLLQSDFKSMFCAHSGYFENGKDMLAKKLANLEKLSSKVQALNDSGLSIREINETVFPTSFPIIGFSKGEWDSKHIVTSILNG
ncbi:MBL fold metallo-hydrolase [Planococcus sp. 1R117A]|uniref:MBL fold metallo-hydrolase n=1 Tax=Planococcus sp. 1R117A TaxID=3447020 RepID=UPI003EDBEDF5